MVEGVQRRSHQFWLSIGTALMAVAMVVLLLFEVQQRNAIRHASELQADSVTALTFQFEREVLRLQRALDSAVHGRQQPFDADELRLRHDLLLSRIALLRDSVNITELVNRPEYARVLPDIEKLMQSLGPALEVPAPQPMALAPLLSELDALGPAVHNLSLASNAQASRLLERQQQEALAQNSRVILLSATILAMLLMAAYALAVRLRNQESEKQAQLQLMANLKDLNEHLEAKVTERTRHIEVSMQDAESSARRASQALSLVEATLEATNNGILVVNREGKVTSANKRFAEMWRIPPALMSAGDDQRVLDYAANQLQDPSKFRKKVDSLYDRPEAISRDRLQFADGRVFERFSHPQRLLGAVVGRVWSFLDVTDQVRAEQRVLQLTQTITVELERAERERGQLQALLSAIPDMVWMKDAAGVFISCNPAFSQLIGAPARAILGKTDHDLAPPEQASAIRANDLLVAQSATPIVSEGWVDHQGQGRQVLLETTRVAVRDAQGVLMGVLGLARDVTVMRRLLADLKQAKEAAQASNEAKSMFLANMSHEIRTPMNAIIGMAELALNTDLTARQRNYLNKINIASEGLLHIINDILDFSKIEAGQMQIERIPFELDDVLEQLSGLMALRAETQGIELAYQVASHIPAVLIGDAMRLGQILINLVSNALKFSSGGNVVVAIDASPLDAAQVELHVQVRDEGIGMSPEQVSMMFQPFIQADASTTRRFGGTGLGLAICRHLVGLLGGKIWAESEVGVGSTFHFTARFQHDVDRRSKGVAQFAACTAGDAHRPVLIVDDNLVARQVLQHLVEQLGLSAITADSAEEALRIVNRADAPEVLVGLIDWSMPATDGIQTMAQLRQASERRGVDAPPLILVTAHSQDEALHKVMHQVDGLLAKPVSARNLYEEIARCLGYASAMRQRPGRHVLDASQWSRFRGFDILLVEDMDINQEVICELLGSVGLSVRLATNGVEALAEVKRQLPDLILMDCHMPVMDGYEATRQLRANPATASLPVIALTASAMANDKRRCFAAGMNAYVTKPVRMEELFQRMAQCLPEPAEPPTDLATSAPVDTPFKRSQLPALPGIDVALGLAQVGGRPQLLLKVLKKFRDHLGKTFGPEFKAAMAAQDGDTAKRLVHSLKGVSTTLGAGDLAERTRALEVAVDQADHAFMPQLLASVEDELRRVCAGLSQIDLPVPAVASSSISAHTVGRLQHLDQLLAGQDAEAADVALELSALMLASAHRQAWEGLARHITNYQFAAAHSDLQGLLNQLAAPAIPPAEPFSS